MSSLPHGCLLHRSSLARSMILLDLGGCNMCLKICASLSNICLFHRRGFLNLRRFKRNRIIPLQWQGCIAGLHQTRPRLFQLHTPTHRLKVGLVMLADGQYYRNKTSMKEVWHRPNVRVFDCWFDFLGFASNLRWITTVGLTLCTN